jgi:hypothetical protein
VSKCRFENLNNKHIILTKESETADPVSVFTVNPYSFIISFEANWSDKPLAFSTPGTVFLKP